MPPNRTVKEIPDTKEVKVVALKRDLKKWQQIKLENIDMICAEEADNQKNLLSANQVVGKFVSRDIKSGEYLKKSDLESSRNCFFLSLPTCGVGGHGPSLEEESTYKLEKVKL